MNKKILIIALIVASVFAVNFNSRAADATVGKTGDSFVKLKKIGRYILLYIPNRFVDATDMFSFNMNVGNSFAWEMQATRYAQLGGSDGVNYFMTKGYSRQIGFGRKKIKRFGLVYGEYDLTYVDDVVGSVREYEIYFPDFLTANYRLEPFHNGDVDFWKFGGNLGWFIGGGFAMHPVEVADFFTGIIGIDISHDDF